MKNKLLLVVLTVALGVVALTGCSNSKDKTTNADVAANEKSTNNDVTTKDETTDNQVTTNDEAKDNQVTTNDEATKDDTSEDTENTTNEIIEKGTIKIAASITPHSEILEQAKALLKAEGWNLEVTIFDDYVLPNLVVESGELDANYFQHVPYLNDFNAEQGTHLVSVGGIHYEPFGIYPGKKADLSTLESGDVIAVPNDTTNEARALLLLQDNGIITLADGVGLEATVNDIIENPYGIKVQELEAAQIARVKDEVAFIILNGNYALAAGLSVAKDAVVYERQDSKAAKTYVNIIVVKEGNEENEGIKTLVNVLKSDEIKQFITDNYDGAVIPFED